MEFSTGIFISLFVYGGSRLDQPLLGVLSGLRLLDGRTSARSKTIALSPHLGLLLGSWW